MKPFSPEQLEHLLKNADNPLPDGELNREHKRELEFFQAIDAALRQDLMRNTSDSFTNHVMGAIDALKPSLAEQCLIFLRNNFVFTLLGSFGVFVALLLYFTPDPAHQPQLYPQEWYTTQKMIVSTSHSLEHFSQECAAQTEGLLRLIIPFKTAANLVFTLLAILLLYSLDRGLRFHRNKL